MAISSTMAASIMAVTAAMGAVVSGINYYQQSQAQQKQAEAQANALKLQAQVESENAKLAAAEKRIEGHRTAAKQITAGAGTGISLQSSSFGDIMHETAGMYEKDARQLEIGGGLRSNATKYSASMYDNGDSSGAIIGAVGTTLGGLGSSYYYGDKAGWFN